MFASTCVASGHSLLAFILPVRCVVRSGGADVCLLLCVHSPSLLEMLSGGADVRLGVRLLSWSLFYWLSFSQFAMLCVPVGPMLAISLRSFSQIAWFAFRWGRCSLE